MGILRNGPNGGFTGKAGAHVGYKLNGQDIIRGLARKRTKKVGAKEQTNRDKFAMMQEWLQPLLVYLRIGFRNYAPTFQGFVAAKSYNSKHAFKQNEDGTWFIDPASALISFGTLPLPENMRMELEGNELVVNWDADSHYHGYEYAMLIAYIQNTTWVFEGSTISKRSAGNATLTLPKHPEVKEYQIYLAFIAYDQSAQSNSHYLGAVTL